MRRCTPPSATLASGLLPKKHETLSSGGRRLTTKACLTSGTAVFSSGVWTPMTRMKVKLSAVALGRTPPGPEPVAAGLWRWPPSAGALRCATTRTPSPPPPGKARGPRSSGGDCAWLSCREPSSHLRGTSPWGKPLFGRGSGRSERCLKTSWSNAAMKRPCLRPWPARPRFFLRAWRRPLMGTKPQACQAWRPALVARRLARLPLAPGLLVPPLMLSWWPHGQVGQVRVVLAFSVRRRWRLRVSRQWRSLSVAPSRNRQSSVLGGKEMTRLRTRLRYLCLALPSPGHRCPPLEDARCRALPAHVPAEGQGECGFALQGQR